MTKNQKAYRNFLRAVTWTAVYAVLFIAVCKNYGQAPPWEILNTIQ